MDISRIIQGYVHAIGQPSFEECIAVAIDWHGSTDAEASTAAVLKKEEEGNYSPMSAFADKLPRDGVAAFCDAINGLDVIVAGIARDVARCFPTSQYALCLRDASRPWAGSSR
jgi:hypothetical protein